MKSILAKPQKFFLFGLLMLLIISVGLWATTRPKKLISDTNNSQKKVEVKTKGKYLSKKLDLQSQAIGDNQPITIALRNWAEQDLINVRPGGNVIAVTAQRLVKREDCDTCFTNLTFGAELSDNILAITPYSIGIDRPQVSNNDVIAIDIEIPDNTNIKVVKGGDILLASKIGKPIVLKNNSWIGGIDSKIKFFVWAISPPIQENGFPPEKKAR